MSATSTPKTRPILFSGPMVRAIIAGQKTVTRRIVRGATGAFWDHAAWSPTVEPDGIRWASDSHVHYTTERCPFGVRGDRLWVRETHATLTGNGIRTVYRADADPPLGIDGQPVEHMKWKPSIFMRPADSRITLEVLSVRVERLGDITEEEARAEGCSGMLPDRNGAHLVMPSRDEFAALWNAINGPRAPWASNPWVWVVAFKRVDDAARARVAGRRPAEPGDAVNPDHPSRVNR